MLRLKQWDPEEFNRLCEEHTKEIEQIREGILEKASYKEMQVIKALEYPIEILREAITDPKVCERVNHAFFPDVFGWGGMEWYNPKKCLRSLLFLFKDIDEILQKHLLIREDFIRINSEVLLARINLSVEIKHLQETIEKESDESFVQRRLVPMLRECEREGWIDRPEEILQKKVREKIEARIRQNMRPFETRYQRFLKLFNPRSTIQLGPAERQIITNPYPLLLASTKLRTVHAASEYNISQARIGSDIDLFFVPPQSIEKTVNWLREQHLDDQVRVLSTEIVEQMQELPLVHASFQAIDYNRNLEDSEQIALNQRLNKYAFPLYRIPYKDGSPRKHHGVPHASRTAFFSLIFMELYHAQGQKIALQPGDLQLAAALHDCAREDDGEDFWDKQSGETCTAILKQEGRSETESTHLGRCIAEKDKTPDCLEQSILHDADCIEILRCLRNADAFKYEELRVVKDFDPDIIYPLIAEAKKFIYLTEKPVIKDFLESTEEPYRALFQIVLGAQEQFPLLYRLAHSGISSLAVPSSYILSKEIEEVISQSWGTSSK